MANSIAVDIEKLELGRELTGAIYDPRGVLLLNAGALLSEESKQRMLDRGVTRVIANVADLQSDANPAVTEAPSFAKLEKRLDERLDALVRSGMATLRNSGPALAGAKQQHGKSSYDGTRAAATAKAQSGNVDATDRLLTGAADQGELDACTMHDVANSCIEQLVGDAEATISATMQMQSESVIASHSVQVATLAMAIGIELGLDAANVRLLGMSAMVSDVGMFKVSPRLLTLARPLTPSEFVEIQRHAVHTANLLEKHTSMFPSVLQIIAYQVHEQCDGGGYPRGRKQQSIHPLARIIHVADAYVAMTSQRPHRPPLMPYIAVRTLLNRAAQSQADIVAVRGLLRAISLFPIGSYVELSNGHVARVLRTNGDNFGRPIVELCQPPATGEASDEAIIDLAESELSIARAVSSPDREEIDFDPRTNACEAEIREFLRRAEGAGDAVESHAVRSRSSPRPPAAAPL